MNQVMQFATYFISQKQEGVLVRDGGGEGGSCVGLSHLRCLDTISEYCILNLKHKISQLQISKI